MTNKMLLKQFKAVMIILLVGAAMAILILGCDKEKEIRPTDNPLVKIDSTSTHEDFDLNINYTQPLDLSGNECIQITARVFGTGFDFNDTLNVDGNVGFYPFHYDSLPVGTLTYDVKIRNVCNNDPDLISAGIFEIEAGYINAQIVNLNKQ